MDLTRAILTPHSILQITGRGIREAEARSVLGQPEAILNVRAGRVVAQAMVGEYLVQVKVDIDRTPPEVVIAYRTSQIQKYRGNP